MADHVRGLSAFQRMCAAVLGAFVGALLLAAALAPSALADPSAPDPTPTPALPAPPVTPADGATAQAAGTDSAPSTEVPHLASPDNLPPGTSMTPVGPPQGRNMTYLKELWHAIQTQDVSMSDALLLFTQRPLDPNAAPPAGVPAGPQAPIPSTAPSVEPSQLPTMSADAPATSQEPPTTVAAGPDTGR